MNVRLKKSKMCGQPENPFLTSYLMLTLTLKGERGLQKELRRLFPTWSAAGVGKGWLGERGWVFKMRSALSVKKKKKTFKKETGGEKGEKMDQPES